MVPLLDNTVLAAPVASLPTVEAPVPTIRSPFVVTVDLGIRVPSAVVARVVSVDTALVV